ncbi:MAG: BON domain-containing protein [Candidatus Binatia bacterium]
MRARMAVWAFALLAAGAGLGGCSKLELARIYFQEKQYATDREIDAQIEGALLAESALRGVRVETYLREVELSGAVAIPADAARAEELARDVSGVRAVRNRITVGREAAS